MAERGAPRWARRAAPVCLVAIAAAVVLFPSASGPAYEGWLPLLSIVTAVLLLGPAARGPAAPGLSWRPLVAIGTISYGVYLYHWPIFTLVDEARLGRGGVVLLAVRLGLTFAAAIVSYRLLERPVRLTCSAPRAPRCSPGWPLTVAILAAVVRSSPTHAGSPSTPPATPRPRPPSTPAGPPTPLEPAGTGPRPWRPPTAASSGSPHPTPSRPVRILVLGDSTAEATGGGLARWAAAHPDLAQVTIEAGAGLRLRAGRHAGLPPGRPAHQRRLRRVRRRGHPRARCAELQPDVVMVMTTAWDVINQRFPGTDAEAPTDPEYGRRIADDFAAVNRGGPRRRRPPQVVWIAEPTVNPYWNPVHSPRRSPSATTCSTTPCATWPPPTPTGVGGRPGLVDRRRRPGRGPRRPARRRPPQRTGAERVATDWLGPAAGDGGSSCR